MFIWQLFLQTLRAKPTLVKFVLVGGTGYFVYQLLLFATYDWSLLWFLPEKGVSARVIFFDHGDVRLLFSTLVAAEISIVFVFGGHDLWTFRDRVQAHRPLMHRFGVFQANQLISALGILTVIVNVLTVRFGFYHFMAAPFGVAAAASWNWLWDTQVIWRRARRDAP